MHTRNLLRRLSLALTGSLIAGSVAISSAAADGLSHVNIRLTSPVTDFSTNAYNADAWMYQPNPGDHATMRYFDIGSTITLTYHVDDGAVGETGNPVVGQQVTLLVNKNWSCSNATFTANDGATVIGPDNCSGGGQTELTGTTDSNGNVTFVLVNTNTSGEPRPSALNVVNENWGSATEVKSNFYPTMSGLAATESVDMMFPHFLAPEGSSSTHANIRLTSPATDFSTNTYNADAWMYQPNPGDHAILRYFDIGSTITLTYHVDDGAVGTTGSPMVGQEVTLIVNKNWSCSNATFTANAGATVINPDNCGGGGETRLTGTTDANGNVTFVLVNTNTTGEPRPSALNVVNENWTDSNQVKSNFYPTLNGATTTESVDMLFPHFLTPAPTPTPTPSPSQASVPSAPQKLTATKVTRGFWLKWNAPQSNGGSAIKDYVIAISSNGRTWKVVKDSYSTSRAIKITGLAKRSYFVRVYAVNSVGRSAPARGLAQTN